jgi:endonuclease/exonuclease/phosphatase family metal-dependent hydrolase
VPRLRVASFNIRNGRALDGPNAWPLRRRTTVATIAGMQADVVGLQEAFGFQLRWLMRRLRSYQSYGLGRDDGRRGEQCPLLVDKGAARIVERATRWFGDDPTRPGSRLPGAGFPRLATMVDVELSAAAPVITIVNTHLDERHPANRRRSAEQLVGWLDRSRPHIVLGDLNATPEDETLAVLASAGMRSALPAHAGGTAHSFTGRRDGLQIDHIFVSDHWEVIDARIVHTDGGPRWPSDHWPIVADLQLR